MLWELILIHGLYNENLFRRQIDLNRAALRKLWGERTERFLLSIVKVIEASPRLNVLRFSLCFCFRHGPQAYWHGCRNSWPNSYSHLFAANLLPIKTGHASCCVSKLTSPAWLRLCQNTARPFLGSTLTRKCVVLNINKIINWALLDCVTFQVWENFRATFLNTQKL